MIAALRDSSVSPSDRRWQLFAVLVPVLVFVDQYTKLLADRYIATRMGGMIPVIDGFFMLRYSRNRGAFFSIGGGLPDGVRVAFFVVAALLALAFMMWVYKKAESRQSALKWGLLLLASGAIGNLIDRVRHGEVVDFLHLHWGERFHWATFNVADIVITMGLVLLLWDAIRAPRRESAEAAGKP